MYAIRITIQMTLSYTDLFILLHLIYSYYVFLLVIFKMSNIMIDMIDLQLIINKYAITFDLKNNLSTGTVF